MNATCRAHFVLHLALTSGSENGRFKLLKMLLELKERIIGEAGAVVTGTLPVMEHFYTLQGEGYHQGRAAYFIRLGGCDVGCVWCDVKESWPAGAHPPVTLEEIVSWVTENSASIYGGGKGGLVVITGGEPLMHNLTGITAALKEKGFETNIETSGAYPQRYLD
ncbi:MAG: 7-carboxy-7-deazaguanine synthase QueE [Ferruginibacter sp.]